jgi:Acyl-CoA synthetase (NDP forming)
MSVRAGAIAGASAGMEKRMDGGINKGEEKKPEKKTEARPGADYELFRAVFEDAGALIADTIAEFESFVSGALLLGGKRVDGNRVALMSNAGFECVVMSDNLGNGEERLEPAAFSTETMRRIGEALAPLGINKIQDIRNPLDVTPVADDAAFAAAAGAVLDDPGVDCAVISPLPLGPVLQTLPAGRGTGRIWKARGASGSG